MALSREITLTIDNYNITLDKEIKIYEYDAINLCFTIQECGIVMRDGKAHNRVMPVVALKAYMLIETPEGVDSVEATNIVRNKIMFSLGNKYSRFVGTGKMQIILKDFDGCRITLPEFAYEVKQSINTGWDDGSFDVLITEKEDTIITDELGRPVETTKISEMDEVNEVTSQTYTMVINEDGNKKIKLDTIIESIGETIEFDVEEIDRRIDEMIDVYDDEEIEVEFPSLHNDVERIKGEINEISESLDNKANKSDVAKMSGGTPLFANSISEMTDTTKNYVNIADGYLYNYFGGAWTNTNVLYQSTGVQDGSIGCKYLDKNILKTTKLIDLNLANDSSVFGSRYNIAVINFAIKDEGFISINLKSSSANGKIKLLHLRKVENGFSVKSLQDVNCPTGIQEIYTNFYSSGDGLDYVGFQNINDSITFGSYRKQIGYYNVNTGSYVVEGQTLELSNVLTNATISFYPSIKTIKVKKEKIESDDLSNNIISVDKLSMSMLKRYEVSYTNMNTSNGTFGGWSNFMLIADYPITKKGHVGLEIKALKDVNNVPVFLINKSEEIYTITDIRYVNIKTGLNTIPTDMFSNGLGTDYIAIKNISTEMIAYNSSNKHGYYTASVTDIVNGAVVTPTKREDATLCFKPFITSDELFLKTRWSDKKINCLGDSLTYGDIVGNGTLGVPWTTHLNEIIKPSKINNYGVGGTNLGGTSANAMVNRYASMEDNADLVIVWGGTNDFCNGVSLGVLGDGSTSTFYGSIDFLIKGLKTKYPNAEICFITPPKINKTGLGETYTPNSKGKVLKDYRNAIIEVCDKYSVPVLDMYSYGSMCPYLDDGTYRPDKLHYSNLGYEKIALKINSFINML